MTFLEDAKALLRPGGVLAYWESEAGQKTQSKPALTGLTIKANKLIALVPLVGPWIATTIVTLGLVAAGLLLLRLLKGRIEDIRAAFEDEPE